MKTRCMSIICIQAACFSLASTQVSFSQITTEEAIVCTIANDVQINSKVLEFDLLLWDSVPDEPYQLSTVQAGIFLNPMIINGGVITPTIVAGSSTLLPGQQPTNTIFTASQNIIKLAAKMPPGCGNGTIISQDPGNRTRVCRFRLTNSEDFSPNSHADLTFGFATFPYGTKISYYSPTCYSTASAVGLDNAYSMAANIILNPQQACPYPYYYVTGGGTCCAASTGLDVGISGSEMGCVYTLFKNGLPYSSPVQGTGDSISFGSQFEGTYTVHAINDSCPSGVFMMGSVVVTEIPVVTPFFYFLGPYCEGSGIFTLPYSSANDIAGTWSPSYVDTDIVGTNNYVFTPMSFECATELTASISVIPRMTTLEMPVLGPYCQGDPPVVLPDSTLNGFTGWWNPPIVNTENAGAGFYHFATYDYECSIDTAIIITVLGKVLPVFLPIGPFCQNSTPPSLPGTSLNGIFGTWDPSLINTSSIGVIEYTFSPLPGQCADTIIVAVETGNQVQASFGPLGPYCQFSDAPELPGSSLNGFTGTWSPQVINTSELGIYNYTFTPGSGQCGVPTIIQIEIISSPGPAGPISGVSDVTWGTSVESYSISAIPGATNYLWTYSGTNTSLVSNGNTAMLYFWDDATSGQLSVYATNNCGSGAASILNISIIMPCYNTTWTGSINSDWHNPGNWSSCIPDGGTCVTIPGNCSNYPLLDGSGENIYIMNLTIQSGGELIGQQFISGYYDSFFEKIIADTNFHFLSSPVVAFPFLSLFPSSTLANVYVRSYDEPTGDWINMSTLDQMLPGKGYSLQMITAPHTAYFYWGLNTTDIVMNLSNLNPGSDLSRVGWTLLGNPFPSAIDWDLFSPGLYDSQVAVWDEAIGGYRYWNHSVGNLIDGIIPPYNGFFVKTSNPGGSTITIPLSAQVFSNHGFYKQSTVPNVLDLKVLGNDYQDDAFIHLNENATPGYDMEFDAFKLWGQYYAPQIYSMIPQYSLSINEIPFTEETTVDLGFFCGIEGIYTLAASGMESFEAGQPIWLEDLKHGNFHDFRYFPEYYFDYSPSDSEKRFRIHFKEPQGIGPNIPVGSLFIYSSNKNIIIRNPTGLTGDVMVFDISGRCLIQKQLFTLPEQKIETNLIPGIYVVSIRTDKGIVSQKVLIH